MSHQNIGPARVLQTVGEQVLPGRTNALLESIKLLPNDLTGPKGMISLTLAGNIVDEVLSGLTDPNSHSASPIITVCVGPDRRLFAAHEDILSRSPHFFTLCRAQALEPTSKRIDLEDEIPEIFSSILEYLYKGDYYPKLMHNKRRNTWELEYATTIKGNEESTISHPVNKQSLLKDTVLYCAADRYGLDELKRLALRKQGLQSGVQCSTILASARYAYANTPDNDSKLRAHYLALLIRSRSTFKRSGTMQMEMESGGRLCVQAMTFLPSRILMLTHFNKVFRFVCGNVQPHGMIPN